MLDQRAMEQWASPADADDDDDMHQEADYADALERRAEAEDEAPAAPGSSAAGGDAKLRPMTKEEVSEYRTPRAGDTHEMKTGKAKKKNVPTKTLKLLAPGDLFLHPEGEKSSRLYKKHVDGKLGFTFTASMFSIYECAEGKLHYLLNFPSADYLEEIPRTVYVHLRMASPDKRLKPEGCSKREIVKSDGRRAQVSAWPEEAWPEKKEKAEEKKRSASPAPRCVSESPPGSPVRPPPKGLAPKGGDVVSMFSKAAKAKAPEREEAPKTKAPDREEAPRTKTAPKAPDREEALKIKVNNDDGKPESSRKRAATGGSLEEAAATFLEALKRDGTKTQQSLAACLMENMAKHREEFGQDKEFYKTPWTTSPEFEGCSVADLKKMIEDGDMSQTNRDKLMVAIRMVCGSFNTLFGAAPPPKKQRMELDL